MSNRLEILFESVKKEVYRLNKKNSNFDGLKFWQPIKKELSKYDDTDIAVYRWKKQNKLQKDNIMKLPEYTINGYGKQSLIQLHHFIIQQIRIPLNEKLTIRKVVQIGLNIGQFEALASASFKRKVDYDPSKLGHLETYVNKKDIEKLSKKISSTSIDKINKLLYDKKHT